MAGWGIAEGFERGVENFLRMQEMGRQRAIESEDRRRGILMQNLQWLGQWDEPTRQALIGAKLDVFDPDFIVKAHQAAGGTIPGAGLLAAAPGGEVTGSSPVPTFSLRRPGEAEQAKLLGLQISNLERENRLADEAASYADANSAFHLQDDTLLNNIPDEKRPSWMRGIGTDYFKRRNIKTQLPQIIGNIQTSILNAPPGKGEAIANSMLAGADAVYGQEWRDLANIGKPRLEGPSAALLAPEPSDPAKNPMLGFSNDFVQNPALGELFFPQTPYEERPPTRMVDPALSNPMFQPLPETSDQRLAHLVPILQAISNVDALHKTGVDPNDTYVLRQPIWAALQANNFIPADKPFRGDFLKTGVMTPAEEIAQNNAAAKLAIDAQNRAYDRAMDQARLGISQGNLDLAREKENRLANQPAKSENLYKRIYSVGNQLAGDLLKIGYKPYVSGVEAFNNFEAMKKKGWIQDLPKVGLHIPAQHKDKVGHEIEVMNKKYLKLLESSKSGASVPAAGSDGTAQVLGYNVVGIGSKTDVHYGTHADGKTFDVTENEVKRRGKSLEQVAKEFVAQGYVVAVRKVGQRGIESNHLHITLPGTDEAKRIAGQHGVLMPSSARTAYKAPDRGEVEGEIRKILKKYPRAYDSQILQSLADSYGLKPGDFKGALGRVRKAAGNA